MKISQTTMAILNNFAGINPSIVVRSGNVLRTVSPQNNILAVANVDEDFPTQFAIYDMKQFLGACSLFKEPTFDFEDAFVNLAEGDKRIRYYYAAPEMVTAPKDKTPTLPSEDVKFELAKTQLSEILKAAGVLGVEEIVIIGDGKRTRVVATDTKNKTSNEFGFDVESDSKARFRFVFKAENLKMINDDYVVTLCAKGIARFENASGTLQYFVAIEQNSEYTA